MSVMYERKNAKKLTKKERLAIVDAAADAVEAGDKKKALEIARRLPVHPRIATGFKKVCGAKYLVDSGVNLDDVLDEFGEEWFND